MCATCEKLLFSLYAHRYPEASANVAARGAASLKNGSALRCSEVAAGFSVLRPQGLLKLMEIRLFLASATLDAIPTEKNDDRMSC